MATGAIEPMMPGDMATPDATFSATPDGLHAALNAFLVQGRRTDEHPGALAAPVMVAETELGTDLYMERILDDALVWAADCSLLQPCSEALAERDKLEAQLSASGMSF